MKAASLILALFIVKILPAQSFFSLPIRANKVLYNYKNAKLYATVNGTDSNYGNMLLQINPNTGAVENNIFVGSEPTVMALTQDSNYLYIALDGASFVKRVDLATFSVDKTISLGNGQFGAMFAEDVSCIFSSPNIVVVSRKYTSVSPRHAGVAAYKNTVKLPNETAGHTGSNIIESVAGTNSVVGFNTESTESGVRKMLVDTMNGVQLISTTANMPLSNELEFNDGLFYTNNGKVMDASPASPVIVGSYPFSVFGNATSVAVNKTTNKTFFAAVNSSQLELGCYNKQTFALAGDSTYSNLFPQSFQLPDVFDLECYGSNGIAVIVGENYFSYKDRRLILFKPALAAGIKENKQSMAVSVYPNPSAGHLHVNLNNNHGDISLRIFDLTGRLLGISEIKSSDGDIQKIDLQHLVNGVYVLKLITANIERTEKIIISR